MKRAIVVGSGAGGAAAARELAGQFDVTVLEAGQPFRPFAMRHATIARLKRAGLLFHPRLISLFFPALRIGKTAGGMFLVRGQALGGSTTVSTGNALRMDKPLQRYWRDAHAGMAHAIHVPGTVYHASALSSLGVDPQGPLRAMI